MVCLEKAARWCWSPGSREALKGTPDFAGIPRELFERQDPCTVNLWPLGHYLLRISLACLTFSSHPLSEFLLLMNGLEGIPLGFLLYLPLLSHELTG